MEIIMLIYILTAIAVIWAIIRAFQYAWGKYSNKIEMPVIVWVGLLIGIFFPILQYIALGYILFWCKPVETLMSIREEAINNITPEEIVEATEQYILKKNFIDDEWVVNTWSKVSTSEWVKRLSSNPRLLKLTLEENTTIHVSNVILYSNWVNLIQYYLYLEERDNLNT